MIETTIAMLVAAVVTPAQCNPAPGVGTLVSVQPVVLQAASGLNSSPTLPPSATQITVGSFVVELWAHQVDPGLGGLICVFSDVTFDSTSMTCNNVTVATQFNINPSGTCMPGLVDEAGGCTLAAGIGVADWVRVATIDMTANFASPASTISAGAASTQISIFACGNVPVARTDFGTAMFDIIQPCTSQAQCDDGDDCNGIEDCDPGGQCVPGVPVVCSGATPICIPSTGACVQCVDSAQCEDFDACTTNFCNTTINTCEFFLNIDCSDGNMCTQDLCNPSTGICFNPSVDCSDGIVCNVDSCDPADGTCSHSTPSPVNLEWSPSVLQGLNYACSGVLSPGDFGQPCINTDLSACSGNPTDCVSEQFTLDLVLRPVNGVPVSVFGLEAILTWDPTKVTLLAGAPSPAYPWFLAGFLDDAAIDDLNHGLSDPPAGLPNSDGDALWSAQGQFDPPLGIGPATVPPAGLAVASFTFTVSSTTLTTIDIAASAGQATRTVVIWGGQFECPADGLPCDPNLGQCAPGVECTRVSEAAGCEIQNGFGSALIPTACTTIADCGDIDGDGITDDTCFWVDCDMGGCNVIPRVFADMGGPAGDCLPDGFANLADALQALTCFANTNNCQSLNIDAGGAAGDCTPDGFCNLADALHALRAFANVNPCSCALNGGGPAPVSAPRIVDHANLFLAASRRVVRPGDQVSVSVFVDNALSDLQSYQLNVESSGGRRGSLELVDISIVDRWDRVFAREADTFDAFNIETGQMLSGMMSLNGVATLDRGYMATYVYRVSDDAVGTFVVDVLPDVQTYLVASNVGTIQVDSTRPAVVVVSPRKSRAAR